jgi:hypothetical protein
MTRRLQTAPRWCPRHPKQQVGRYGCPWCRREHAKRKEKEVSGLAAMRWRIRRIDHDDRPSDVIDVELTVESVAPAVVNAIEQAAERHGVHLIRLTDEYGRSLERQPAPEVTP